MRTGLWLATKRMQQLEGVVVLFEGKLKYAPQTVGDTTQISQRLWRVLLFLIFDKASADEYLIYGQHNLTRRVAS